MSFLKRFAFTAKQAIIWMDNVSAFIKEQLSLNEGAEETPAEHDDSAALEKPGVQDDDVAEISEVTGLTVDEIEKIDV
jgi:hypothetical protein